MSSFLPKVSQNNLWVNVWLYKVCVTRRRRCSQYCVGRSKKTKLKEKTAATAQQMCQIWRCQLHLSVGTHLDWNNNNNNLLENVKITYNHSLFLLQMKAKLCSRQKTPKFIIRSNELLRFSSILKKSIDLVSLKARWCVSAPCVHFSPLYISTLFPSIHHDPSAAFFSSLTSNSGPPPDEDRPGCKSNFHDPQ